MSANSNNNKDNKSIKSPSKQSSPHSHHTHWLMKNEPPFSLYELQQRDEQTEPWVGVRNGEAKNIMMYAMKVNREIRIEGTA